MPLPSGPQPWPPTSWLPIQRDIEEASAWYAGEEAELARFYDTQRDDVPRRLADRILFWRKNNADLTVDNERFHVPAAADIAATSADLLFGDTPTLTIPEAHEETENPEAVACEDYLVQLMEDDGIASKLLEGAELNAALGGVYLRAMWDEEIADHPMLDIVHGDQAVPEFKLGHLVAVTFWRCVMEEPGGAVWRHLERHERGVILHGLYIGDRKDLGARVDLARHESTRGLAEDIALPASVAAFGPGIACRYVPNAKPNRKRRKHPLGYELGRSDFDGTYSLMDRLDMAWSSWMRDIDLGKSRIITPDQFLTRAGRGKGAYFDTDQRIFSPLNMDPQDAAKAGIQFVQPQIRTDDHAKACLDLFERIIVTAGYSPQSFGLQGDGAQMTATEVDARSGKSDRTTDRKRRNWKHPVEDIGFILLMIAADQFGAQITPMRPRLDFPDASETDLNETATSLELINRAQAASIETKVRTLHKDWNEKEIQDEVDRIKEEVGVSVPDPTGGFGAPAVPPPGEGATNASTDTNQ